MKITREYLLSLTPRPCEDGLASFDAAFPEGLTVEGEPDEETLAKLAKLGLGWLARTLPDEARAAYFRARDLAWSAYFQATYEQDEAEAWATYSRARARVLWRIVADMEVPS